MGFLDWLRRNGSSVKEPSDDPTGPRHFTVKGNAIDVVSSSGWLSDDAGLREFRHHIGKSVEGYHGGLEVSHRGGEGPFLWTNKRPTPEVAENASYRMRDAYEYGYEKHNPSNPHDLSSKPGEMPFRFQKPFEHVPDMTEQERRVVDTIHARWVEQYEEFKSHPPMSESQQHDRNVFRAIDAVHRAVDARERAPSEQWAQLETQVEQAFNRVRRAFGEQRQFVSREVAELEEYLKQLAPDTREELAARSRKRDRSWER